MSFFSRYKDGEHVAVWKELRALGDLVRDPCLFDDASAVAATTMRRARRNLVRIEAGLYAAGYRFGRSAAAKAMSPLRLVGSDHIRADMPSQGDLYESRQGDPASSVYPSLRLYHGAPSIPRDEDRGLIPLDARSRSQLDRFEQIAGTVPLSLHWFWTVIGAVDFIGHACFAPGKADLWDPVVINPPDELMDAFETKEPGPFHFILGPDSRTKADGSGGVTVAKLPGAGADVELAGYGWLVDHLRKVTRLAGFPAFGHRDNLPPALKPIASGWEAF